MTKFVAYYNLCPIHDPKEFLGISPDRTEGNIITTLDKNIIIIIKISTQKQIRSWSVLEKLSTKVVYDRQSQQYVGVFAKCALRCWNESCEDVNKCKKLKFKKSIADLVTAGEKTYVLYGDGSCELLAKAIESRKEQTDDTRNLGLATNSIFDARAFRLSNGVETLTYFERQLATDDVVLVHLRLEEGRGINPMRYKLARPCQPDYILTPTGYTVVEGENALMLLSIWSDNRIFMLKLDNSVEPESSPGKFVSMMSSLKVDSQMSVLGISRNFVAIYGANSGQEGASLLLYNTQFHVIKTKQFFKVYLDFSRLWTVGQYILLAMGQNLSVVSYRKSPDLISDLLGTQAGNNFETQIEGDHINEEEPLQECIKFLARKAVNTAPEVASVADYKIDTENTVWADGKTVPFESASEFDQALSALNRLEMSTRVVRVETALEHIEVALMSNHSDNGFVTPEVQQIAQQLENCGASEYEISEKLLTLLIRANLLADIAVCLRRYSNISDKMLTKVLQYALNQRASCQQSMQCDEEDSVNQSIPARISHLLNLVFTCNFNADNIAAHIRRNIDYESVIVLMDYLYNLLDDNAGDITYPSRPMPQGVISDCTESEMQILRWFTVLFSNHFQKLVLSKDVLLVEILFKWHLLCERYKAQLNDLEETAAILYNIIQKKELSKDKHLKWYSIEEVDLY